MSEAKPLRWSFLLTFPIVMAAIWGVFLLLAGVERSQLVAKLNTLLADGSVAEAKVALRQMGRMPDPPVKLLVAAAASPSRQVAREAQLAISELLRRSQRQLKAKRSPRQVARRLQCLAATLDAERASFSPRDSRWLAKTTEQIVRLANAAPPEDAIGLAAHCESLLAMTQSSAQGAPIDVIPAASSAIEQVPDSIFSPPSPSALQSILPTDEVVAESAAGRAANNAIESNISTPRGPLRWSPRASDPTTEARQPLPFFRRNQSTIKTASPIPEIGSTGKDSKTVDPWATIDSRKLVERWLTAGGAVKLQIERELQHRGFGNVRPDIARLALSDNTSGRVQLVHDLMDLPGVGAKAWLMLLADDPVADVRLEAVTVMATSSDPELIEKAWQIALHDRDPRIAGLADRLRNRREAAQRR